MEKHHSPTKQAVYILVGILCFAVISLLPEPEPFNVGAETIVLTYKGKLCVGLLVVAIFYWITEVFPFHITAMIVLLVMPLFKITDGMEVLKNGKIIEIQGMAAGYKEIVRISFGNELILFFLGVFLLSGAFLMPGDALMDENGDAVNSGMVEARFTFRY